jgi:hypothetical protein
MRLSWPAPVLLAACLLHASLAAAQDPLGGEFRVNAFTTGEQAAPRAAADAVGNFVVAWTSDGQDGYGQGVFAQRFDAAGARRGDEFRVNLATTGNQALVSLSGDPAGNFIVAWTSSAAPGRLVVQRFSAEGKRRGAELEVEAAAQPSLGANARGRFVVAWSGGGIHGQRFDAGGNPQGASFQVNTYTSANVSLPSVGLDDAGGFVVAWSSNNQEGIPGVHAQRFDSAGAGRGAQFRVTPLEAESAGFGVVAVAPAGGFLVAYNQLLSHIYNMVFGRRYSADGVPSGNGFRFSGGLGAQFDRVPISVAALASNGYAGGWSTAKQLNPVIDTALARRFGVAGDGPVLVAEDFSRPGIFPTSVAADGSANIVAVFSAPEGGARDVFAHRFGSAVGVSVAVDPAGNGVLEPGEAVAVRPSWRNVGPTALDLGGGIALFEGPAGATYGITDGSASYGTVAAGATAPCADCYVLSVSNPAPRPVQHWDTRALEIVSPATQGQEKPWTLHVGRSFADVPPASPFYRFVETLLHRGVASGTGGLFLPAAETSREQMAVFVLAAREGDGWVPPPCAPPNVFADVPETSPFCRWIEELARRGVVSGCGGGNFCPGQGVTREEMAVFLLRTLDETIDPPPCAAPDTFPDVPGTSPFCRWVEELARRGVTGGCGGGNFCPQQVVTREQMAVFLTVTFGLGLYGPY